MKNFNHKNTISFLIIFSVSLLLSVSFFSNALADEQLPGIVIVVESDPYYFSANDFGIEILKYFQRSFDPYLVPGITDENSSIEEISAAYDEKTAHITSAVIVSDKDRALLFRVHFSNGEIQEKQTFDTFLKFTQSNLGSSQKGLELESLLTLENQWFYENIILRSINSADKPEPFDVDVDIITGDTSTLQRWQYSNCVVSDYMPYLDESIAKVKFVGSFVSEIRDKTNFECDGFAVNFNLDVEDSDLVIDKMDYVPQKETQAKQIIVEFSGGALENTIPSYTFSKFTPLRQVQNLPVFVPGYSIDGKSAFALESLPSKDKEELYVGISKYVVPGKDPEPFDVSVHLTTSDGIIIQTWGYSTCSAISYIPFFLDSALFFKFTQTSDSEIRDKTNFECNGLEFISKSSIDTELVQTVMPNDFERAQTFVVSFEGPDISPEKIVSSFTKFAPITNEELPILLPNYVFEETPKFYLESLPSKQNHWYYELISRYINSGAIPEPFTTTINVLTGDGTIIQTWNYKDCEVLEYKSILDDLLFKRKFSNEYLSEIKDRTIFECVGFSFDGTSIPSKDVVDNALHYVDFIPSEKERADRFVVTLSDGDFTEPMEIHTFEKFTPVIEQRKDTVYRFVGGSATVYDTGNEGLSTSTFVNTNSKEDPSSRSGPPDCPPNSNSPQCNPDNPGNGPPDNPGNDPCDNSNPPPKCDLGNPGDPGIPPGNPTDPGEPLIPELPTDPSYYVVISEPHFSTIQTNDYQKSLRFHLESLPTKDKEKFYDFISRYYNAGEVKPQPFDVTVDIVTGDGSVLQSWKYSKCELDDFGTYMQDNLFYFTMNGKKGVSEIREKSSFDCVGFSVNFDENKLSYEKPSIVTDDSNRAMFYIAHLQDGEFRSQKSTALVQKINSLPENNLLLAGLTNVFHEKLYNFVGSYVNPGKDPEVFDFRYDVVTGDGTILFSGKYTECHIANFATYYNDQLFYVKFAPSLESEIRSRGILDCIGMDLIVSPQKDPLFDTTGNLRKFSPLTQRAIGVPADDTVCNDGKSVMIRPPKDMAICIKDEHVSDFEGRGWEIATWSTSQNLSQTLSQPIPTDDERAETFSITFEGADISPEKTSDTFSKFVPINNGYSLFLNPNESLDKKTKQFYLESLPSKDKEWFYDIISRYINPGKIPEPFNITVEILAASGDLIQVWDYDQCSNSNYELFLDESLLIYKLHQKWDSEIKDRTFFQCEGLNLNDVKD